MRALLVDAYDSFVHIIYQYLRRLGVRVDVVRCDECGPREVRRAAPDLVVLGPGPGRPEDAGYVPLVRELRGSVPLLGICLGHQAIALAYGGSVVPARRPRHGKTSEIHHDGRGCFRRQRGPVRVTRYHSLVVAEADLPTELAVTARSADDGHIMGLRDADSRVESLQFHPESITTTGGLTMIADFISGHVAAPTRTADAPPLKEGAR
uniref:ADC synthase II n=1 Tax=Streptoalloteichus sp. ATCC 53650 TaxID=756733 RepID=K4P0V8_9PSEU|nr:ADC synthase II [Streptoalloteichus sp. ATCC 53650]